MLRFIALRGVLAHMRTWNIHKTGKTLYIGIEAVLSFNYNWKTNNKSCKIICRLNTSTNIRYILVVCVM